MRKITLLNFLSLAALLATSCIQPYDDFQEYWERDSVPDAADASAEVMVDTNVPPDLVDSSADMTDGTDVDDRDDGHADTVDINDQADLGNLDTADAADVRDTQDSAPHCGDDFCGADEDCDTCPEDCGQCPMCGDSQCTPDENCDICPQDCGECCGDGECQEAFWEDCMNCPEDCNECCGNGLCDPQFGEQCLACPEDCGECCGNGQCDVEFDEDCYWCQEDCGECCGDEQCQDEFNEDCWSCPDDCGECCGDGLCLLEHGEDCTTCSQDCGDCCGNGLCQPELDENCDDCPMDCPCADGEVCFDSECCAPVCEGLDCGDDGCGGTCGECGVQHVCEYGMCVCQPDCLDMQCGDDGCGGSCGDCMADLETCQEAFGWCAALSLPVPAGDFWMGCNPDTGIACHQNELPYHKVTTSAFSMDATEVTNARYLAFLNLLEQTASPNECGTGDTPAPCVDLASSAVKMLKLGDQWVVSPTWKNHPATGVTWYGAQAYCQWAGGRLCSEAEWVKSARGGCELIGPLCKLVSPAFPWGNQPPECDQANAGYCNSTTQPVAQYDSGKSEYGMYDMLGNVWEMVGDCFHASFAAAPLDGSAWVDGCDNDSKIRVGGAYNVSASNVSIHLRSAANAGSAVAATGFRCCQDPD